MESGVSDHQVNVHLFEWDGLLDAPTALLSFFLLHVSGQQQCNKEELNHVKKVSGVSFCLL